MRCARMGTGTGGRRRRGRARRRCPLARLRARPRVFVRRPTPSRGVGRVARCRRPDRHRARRGWSCSRERRRGAPRDVPGTCFGARRTRRSARWRASRGTTRRSAAVATPRPWPASCACTLPGVSCRSRGPSPCGPWRRDGRRDRRGARVGVARGFDRRTLGSVGGSASLSEVTRDRRVLARAPRRRWRVRVRLEGRGRVR